MNISYASRSAGHWRRRARVKKGCMKEGIASRVLGSGYCMAWFCDGWGGSVLESFFARYEEHSLVPFWEVFDRGTLDEATLKRSISAFRLGNATAQSRVSCWSYLANKMFFFSEFTEWKHLHQVHLIVKVVAFLQFSGHTYGGSFLVSRCVCSV